SRDGKILACAGDDRVLLAGLGHDRHSRRLPGRYLTSVAFAPGGNVLVAAGSTGIDVWQLQPRTHLRRHIDGDLRSVSFSADGKRLVSGHGDGSVRLWDVATATQLGSPLRGHTGWAWSVAFGPS